MTCRAHLDAFTRCGLPNNHPPPCVSELDVARRDRDAMAVTLTIAQTRCTELLEENRRLREPKP